MSVTFDATSNKKSELVRIRFQTDRNGLAGGSPERLWAKPLAGAETQFELQNSPFYAKGVSYLDIVEADRTPDTVGEWAYLRTVIASGHSTYRVLVDKDSKNFSEWRDRLALQGCTYEYSDEGTQLLYAVDVPASANIFVVYEILDAGERESVWTFDEGHCGHLVESEK